MENHIATFEPRLFCVDAPVCGDGRVSGSETCDYRAAPTGCGAGDTCNFACECEPVVCPHTVCETNGPLPAACGPCEALVCANDSFCCNTRWDGLCVSEAEQLCGIDCSPPPYGSPTRAFLSAPFLTMFE